MFSSDFLGALYASAVPLVMTLNFFLIGCGAIVDEDTVNSAARNGERSELLRGPLLYGIVFVLCTLFFWKQSRGIISLFILCFGDGFAEIFGRMFGSTNKLFWCQQKSLAGLLGFILSSVLFTCLFLHHFGDVVVDRSVDSEWVSHRSTFARVVCVATVSGLVETLPIAEIDNFTIFIAGVASDIFICSVLR